MFTWMTHKLKCTLPWPEEQTRNSIQYYFEVLKGVVEGFKLLSERITHQTIKSNVLQNVRKSSD